MATEPAGMSGVRGRLASWRRCWASTRGCMPWCGRAGSWRTPAGLRIWLPGAGSEHGPLGAGPVQDQASLPSGPGAGANRPDAGRRGRAHPVQLADRTRARTAGPCPAGAVPGQDQLLALRTARTSRSGTGWTPVRMVRFRPARRLRPERWRAANTHQL